MTYDQNDHQSKAYAPYTQFIYTRHTNSFDKSMRQISTVSVRAHSCVWFGVFRSFWYRTVWTLISVQLKELNVRCVTLVCLGSSVCDDVCMWLVLGVCNAYVNVLCSDHQIKIQSNIHQRKSHVFHSNLDEKEAK